MQAHSTIKNLIHFKDNDALARFLGKFNFDQDILMQYQSGEKDCEDGAARFNLSEAERALQAYHSLNNTVEKNKKTVDVISANNNLFLRHTHLEQDVEHAITKLEKDLLELQQHTLEIQTQYQDKKKKLEGLKETLQLSESYLMGERIRQKEKRHSKELKKNYIKKARWTIGLTAVSLIAYKVFLILQETKI